MGNSTVLSINKTAKAGSNQTDDLLVEVQHLLEKAHVACVIVIVPLIFNTSLTSNIVSSLAHAVADMLDTLVVEAGFVHVVSVHEVGVISKKER